MLVKKKTISLFLAFSMAFTSVFAVPRVNFAEEAGVNEEIVLESGKQYDVKVKQEAYNLNKNKPPYALKEDGGIKNSSGSLVGDESIVNAKLRKEKDGYTIEIPVIKKRIEQNFRINIPRVYDYSNFQEMEENNGQLGYGENLDLTDNENASGESGQFKYELKNISIRFKELKNNIFVKSILTYDDAVYKNYKCNIVTKYKIDIEDLKSKLGFIDSNKIKEILSDLDYKDGSTSDNNQNENPIEKFTLVLKNGERVKLPEDYTDSQFNEIKNKILDGETGLDTSKYINTITIDGNCKPLEDVLESMNFMKDDAELNETVFKYLKLISTFEETTIKYIILASGEKVKIPNIEDSHILGSKETPIENYNEDLRKTTKYIFFNKKPEQTIDLKSYPEKITLDGEEKVVTDLIEELLKIKPLPKFNNDNNFKKVLEKNKTINSMDKLIEFYQVLSESEKKTEPSESKDYAIKTTRGIKKINKESLANVTLDRYNEIKSILEDLDEVAYSGKFGKYENKQGVLKAYNQIKEADDNTTKKLQKPTYSFVGKPGTIYESMKKYIADDEYLNNVSLTSIIFNSNDDSLDNRIDYKFTLDGSEPNENSESIREYEVNKTKITFDNSALVSKDLNYDDYTPIRPMPDSLIYGRHTTMKVKAFCRGYEASDTLEINIKHTPLCTNNYFRKNTLFNGDFHETDIGIIKNYIGAFLYYDTELVLNEANSGDRYNKVKKELNSKGYNNFTVLDYKLVDSKGKLASIIGEWKSDVFNSATEGIYEWSVGIRLKNGRDLYPINLENNKVKIFKTDSNGSLKEINTQTNKGGYYDAISEANGLRNLTFDINNNQGSFVVAQIEDNLNIGELKNEYKKLVDFLESKDSKSIYEEKALENLSKTAKGESKAIESENDLSVVKNKLNSLKEKIHELKKNDLDASKVKLKDLIKKAKLPLTRVLKTPGSLEKLDKLIKNIESNIDNMDEKQRKEAIKELESEITHLDLVEKKGFAQQPNNIADGEYEVPIQLRHFYKTGDTSMGNSAIEGMAILKVKGQKQSLIFDVKGVTLGDKTGRIVKMRYFEPGKDVLAEKDLGTGKDIKIIEKKLLKGFDGKEREYIQKVELPIDSDKSNPMRYIGISVDVMNGIFEKDPDKDAFQYAPVVIDYRQLKPVNGTQPNPQPDPNPQPQPNKWNVPVQLKHGYEDKNSMGSAALLPTATIEKKSNGKYEYTIKFKGIHANFGSKEFYGHLYGLKIYKDGFDSEKTEIQASKTLKDKDIVGQERDFPAEYKFTLDKLSDLVKIQVAVDAMDAIMNGGQAPYDIAGAKWKGAQNARLILDISSIPKEPNPSNPTPDLPKPDESIENAKAQLKKDLEIAKHLVNSGIAKGNSKGILERAIKKVEGVLGKSNPTYLELVSASQVLNFAILSIKDDANPNDNIKTDEKIDKGKLDGGIVDKNDDKDTKIYSVPAKLWHAYENKESMGNPAMEKDIIVKVSKNKFEYYVSFKGLSFANKYGHLWDLSVYDTGLNGSLRPAIIDKEYRDTDLEGKQRTFPKRYKFIRNGKEDKIYVKVAVDAMDAISSNQASTYDKISKGAGSQNAILVFDWSKAKEYTDNNANDENKSRISGSDRYETSALISRQYFKNADTVVLASGINSADALVSASFAKINKAPILLSSKADIPSSVENEISRLKAKNIVIVGGNSSISPAVEKKLKDAGYKVSRISGSNRYETASILAQRVRDLGGSNKAILINGEKSADALTVSSLATKSDIPVLLVNSRKIDSSVKSKLDSWNVNELLIVGGSGSIPNSIVNNIRANKKRRIAGADRFDTAIEIAKESYSNPKTVMLSNGYNAIDALSAGAVTEKAQAPILLVRKDSIPSKVRSMVDNNSSKAVLLGGVNTISSWVESSLNK